MDVAGKKTIDNNARPFMAVLLRFDALAISLEYFASIWARRLYIYQNDQNDYQRHTEINKILKGFSGTHGGKLSLAMAPDKTQVCKDLLSCVLDKIYSFNEDFSNLLTEPLIKSLWPWCKAFSNRLQCQLERFSVVLGTPSNLYHSKGFFC